MARKKTAEKPVRQRKVRTPRERKAKPAVSVEEDRTWLVRSKHKAMAVAILNGNVSFTWWCSEDKDGAVPVTGYYPCTHFLYAGRVYFGFAFRHHRDEYVELNLNSLKVTTETAHELQRRIRS